MSRFLGIMEHMVLLAIERCEPPAYGAAIMEQLGSATDRTPSSGALSTTLDRLEQKGLVRSRYGKGGGRRGGRPIRIVEVTASGRAALTETQAVLRRLGEDPAPEPS